MKLFRELTKEERSELFKAWLNGQIIECIEYKAKEWQSILNPAWNLDTYYRIKPIELTKPSINWDHVHSDYNWLAVDENGDPYLYSDKPEVCSFYWFSHKNYSVVKGFSSYKPGACNWEDSLVKRGG